VVYKDRSRSGHDVSSRREFDEAVSLAKSFGGEVVEVVAEYEVVKGATGLE